jgi:hypothetical protein
MRRLLIPLALLTLSVAPATAAAVPAGTYKGRATNMDRDFRYGKVRVVVRNDRIRRVLIESVTTSGCGGFMSVVFAPSDPELKILEGSTRIRNGRFFVKYQPEPSVEDQTTTMRGRFSGGRVTGTFSSGDLCENEGRFTARR